MFKRVTIVALVVAAFVLMLAVPALAFNGYRGDYTTTPACQTCHAGTAGIPAVYHEWLETKHAEDEEGPSAARTLPYGSVCAGCHTSNYAPGKVVPVPTATSSAGAVSWAASPSTAAEADQTTGESPFSEDYIGCSSCHYGANVAGGLATYGVDTNDTAHNAPYGDMANADICGSCHSRYSYTVDEFAVQPVPYLTVTTPTPGTPITPNPNATSLIQPQMAIGYPMLGAPASPPATGWNPAAPLTTYLNIPKSGWTPTPTATTGGFGRLQTYWQVAGQDSLWQQTGHDGSAAQYPEWANEGHARALTDLTGQSFWAFLPEATKQECLECHSADFRIMKEAGKAVTSADVKYGITCVGCHSPHEAGTIVGKWDEEFDAQLNNDASLNGNSSNLCIECHNGEIPVGSTASPGAEIHHPMREMMDGYGAIDVSAFPSVHKGKCVQCHMPPTSWSRGNVQLAGNHTFNIITPEDAVEASPVPVVTATAVATATPVPAGTPVITTTITVTRDSMPYSACSTCHYNNNGLKKSPMPVSTTTATPTPGASPLRVTVTLTQNANETPVGNLSDGDKALWLQDTIDQRQEWTRAKIAEIHTELNAGAVRLGYADEAAAHEALVAIPAADRTFGQTNFLKAFTNVGYVESEGSFGLHNWDYSREIVNVALAEARAVQAETPAPRKWVVTMKASKSSMAVNQKVKFRGLVLNGWGLAGKGTLTIQRKLGSGAWKNWTTTKLATGGTYGKTMKMTQKGTWKIRGYMPGDGNLNLAAYSVYVTVKVK